jgi:hypothetical protein
MNRHWLSRRLRLWGARPALICKSWSFARLCDDCDVWRDQLAQHGIKPGDTLAICGDYSPKLCALLLCRSAEPPHRLPAGVRNRAVSITKLASDR